MRLRKYITIISIIILLFSFCAPLAFAVDEISDENIDNSVVNETIEDTLNEIDIEDETEDEIEQNVEYNNIVNNEISYAEEENNVVVQDNTITSEIVNKISESKVDEEKQEVVESGESTAIPSIVYSSHVQNIGWQAEKADGQLSGTEGKSLRLEGLKISLKNTKGTITYQTHVQNIGWQASKSNGAMAGTEGKSLRIEAIKINLSGDVANDYTIMYRVHIEKYGWLGWAKNGEQTGSEGLSLRMEAIEIKLVPKKTTLSSGGNKIYYRNIPTVNYKSHVQNIGWQNYVTNGGTSGTSGKALRMEALQIKITNTSLKGDIEYSTHVQNIGWQGFVKNGATTGTSGKSLRAEAIKIRLTGELEANYDIYYRVHCQNVGWLDWAKNGGIAGTTGCCYRMEAIQIVLVEKNSSAPGSTISPYVSNKTGTVYLDLPKATHIGASNQSLLILGWAVSDSANSELKIYVDGKEVENVTRLDRADVTQAFPQYAKTSPKPAFSVEIDFTKLTNTQHTIRIVLRDKQLDCTIAELSKNFVKFKDIRSGIDVSRHNARGSAGYQPIDWSKVKNQVDFAIVRCGYGQNLDSNGGYLQDDDEFYYNMDQCRKYNIPVEVYLYSYADNTTKASSEADHVIRLCKNYKDIVHMIWYDVEDDYLFNKVRSGAVSKSTVGAIVDTFANKLKKNGYNVGLYSYKVALQNYFSSETINKYDIWLAQYVKGVNQQNVLNNMSSYPGTYVMWQYTNNGTISGITTAVDMNLRFVDFYK